MGSAESNQISAVLDGQTVVLTYNPHEDIDKRALRWQSDTQTNLASTQDQILHRDIVTIVKPGESQTEHKVFYVKTSDESLANTSASPVTLHSVTVSQLPESLLQEFSGDVIPLLQNLNQVSSTDSIIEVIISIGSGTRQADSVWENLLKPLLTQLNLVEGKHFRAHVTQSDQTIIELTRDIILPRANEGLDQTIVLLSGDGGMLDIVNPLLSSQHTPEYRKPKVAVLPLGTGNALAHSGGITNDNTLGTRALLYGHPKEVPLFRAKFSPGARLLVNEARDERELHQENGEPVSYGAVVASWCFHATLVADSDTAIYRKFGAQRFKMAAKEALFPEDGSPPHAYRGEISFSTADDSTWKVVDRTEHGYVLATYCHQLERGFTISPASKPLDGELRLVHFGALTAQEGMDVMAKAYKDGAHVDDERVGYEGIKALRISINETDARWRRICIDGRIIRVEEGGWVEVTSHIGGVVDMIIPE